MNEKFKMTKLLIDAGVTWYPAQVADHLLANGVIVPPISVGQTVYRVYTRSWVGEDKVCELNISNRGICYVDDKGRETLCDKIGKTVFLSREDAEKALREEKLRRL
jgi:hypothetical protein